MKGINIPIYLKIEDGITDNILNYLNQDQMNFRKVLIVSGVNKTSLIANKIVNQLKNELDIYHMKISDNSIRSVWKVNEYIILNECSLVIGIGGGKVLDVCKYSAYMSRIDFVSVPTTISHDGIASPIAVIKYGDKVKSIGCDVPKSILIDLTIIKKSPLLTRKAGVGDILSNITAIYDWKLASLKKMDLLHDFALTISETAYKSILYHPHKDLNNIYFLHNLSKAIILSGLSMEISGNSRPCSGSEHLFSHALDFYTGPTMLPHGIQVAIGSVMSSYMQEQNYYEQIEFLKEFEIPFSPKLGNINRDNAIKGWMLAKNTRPNRYTILDEIDFSYEEFSRVVDYINAM